MFAVARDSPSYGVYDGAWWYLDVTRIVAYHLDISLYNPLYDHLQRVIKRYGKEYFKDKSTCLAFVEGYKSFINELDKFTTENTGVQLWSVR